jgi:hypothetical protein
MLEPQDRRLLLEALRPPDGYSLDRALGTTYSLDLLALLTAPLAFTMFDWEDEDGRPTADPLALLEALRRYADRTAVFCQAGQIKVPPGDQLLLGYLESSIVESAAPVQGGVFHPKVWVLRFVAPGRIVLYRMLCLSRNLTFDRSWDTILALDGELAARRNAFAGNHTLADFVGTLPSLAVRSVPQHVEAIVGLFQDELRRVRFELPDGCDELYFHALGHDGRKHSPFGRVERALVISPFASDAFLTDLTEGGTGHVLVSRMDSLQALKTQTLKQFDTLCTLREGAEAEGDGEGAQATSDLVGLHAKVFVVDDGWNASVYCGSANATDAAFARNVEFMVELRGKKSKYGVAATLVSERGGPSLSSLFEQVKVTEVMPGDPISERLDALLAEARRAIWTAGFSLDVGPEAEGAFRVRLRRSEIPRLPEGTRATARPITLREEAAQDLTIDSGISFGPLTFEALTSFLAVEIRATVQESTESCRFALNLPLVGAPIDRKERLLRALLRNREQVLRLLLLLLSEGGLDAGALLGAAKDGVGGGWGAHGHAYLFESLMKALARAPHKLDDVATFFADLSRSDQTKSLLPEGFETVWRPIWEARERLTDRGHEEA